MADTSYRTLMRQESFKYLLMLCAGVWLFAADRLMESTLLPDIVRDIGGANLIGWGRTLFETAAIITGMLSAFLVRRWGVRWSFSGSAAIFVIGCIISALANEMLTFQAGRFLQALAGSAFVSLTAIGIANMFPPILLARAGSIVAIVWGFAAFSGPLVGGLFSEYATWRWAFIYLTVFGSILTIVSFFVLGRHPVLAKPQTSGEAEPFPALRMAVLLVGVMSIASGGISFSPVMTPILVVGGLILIAVFLKLDRGAGSRRLLPIGVLRLTTKIGAVSYLVLALSAAVIGKSVFAPILLVSMYNLPLIQIGFMMFATALGWTFSEMVFSGTQPAREGRVIVMGAALVTLSIITFNIGTYAGQVWMFPLGFLLEGIGLGMSWALISRRAIADNPPEEKSRIAGSIHTLQRIGFALGVAGLGMMANIMGFAGGMDAPTAQYIFQWILGLSLPMALAALGAAYIFAGAKFNPVKDYSVEPMAS